jgi:type I restriction enzyme R subunit
VSTIDFKESAISRQPAVELLKKSGYEYLSPEQALELRDGKTTNVLLMPVLREQLEKINSIRMSASRTTSFSVQNIENGIEALRNVPMDEGFIGGSEYVHNLLTLGKTLEQSIDGDRKSFTLNYVDWKYPERNVFHVTEEFTVSRTGTNKSYRPDIVLFVNGVPLCIVECKRPDVKDSLEQSVSQHLRNQHDDGIRSLYVYSALLVGVNTIDGTYATVGTPAKFWAKWHEQFADGNMEKLHAASLQRLTGNRQPSEQDAYLYNLCRPERLLELMFHFTVYDEGVKKIARYQQYFAIVKIMDRIRRTEGDKRRGGVVWHTQGSGKSLTMVMLAQAIALDETIRNPKIILVTDRTDLDRQITGTFKKCGIHVNNAATGKQLAQLLENSSDAVITTIINKFELALSRIRQPLADPNIFVLVDEGHRSQYGEMNARMQKALPNACFIAMTGTPLMKKEKNTAARFGGIILPAYTVDQAIRDKAVVPLLYEGRIVPQIVRENPVDKFFEKVSEPLTEYQRADMKRKFSRANQLNRAEQRIYRIAWDISEHFRDNWQGTGFKAQLVCPKKLVAIRYKQFMDEIGIVSSEVLITSPDDREGDDSTFGESPDAVKSFWKKMMDEHGTMKKYEGNLINRYKKSDSPEIIIVVDKLLTGFDEPKNTVMYLDRSLREHKLFQAIARVNRVCEGKEFGYVIDYYGVLQPLYDALNIYSEYDPDDVTGAFTDISDEIKKLPQKHSDLRDIFKHVPNKGDLEAYSRLLRHEDIRQRFYECLTAFARTLGIALSSLDFHKNTDEAIVNRYREDLTMFLKLRKTVQARYSDNIDYKKYELQIQKLIDTHVESSDVKILTKLVGIFDKEKFAEEVEKITGKAAKADTIASRTAKHITENMDADPAFYKKFSALLKETIDAYEQGRIDEIEYLRTATELKDAVLSHTDSDIPAEIADNNTARAYFGLCMETMRRLKIDDELSRTIALNTAVTIDCIVRKYALRDGIPVIDWQTKTNLIGKMKTEIDDHLIDEVKRKYEIPLSFDDIDDLNYGSVEVAKLWLK